MRQFLLISLILPAFGLIFFSAALAQGLSNSAEQLEKLTQEISETTMSPYCPGRTISSCPSIQARELREQIYDWFAQGYSRKAVMNQLFTIYGEEVRGMPKTVGFGRMAWIAPGLFVLLGGLFISFYLKRRGLHIESPLKRSEVVDDEMVTRIETELLERNK